MHRPLSLLAAACLLAACSQPEPGGKAAKSRLPAEPARSAKADRPADSEDTDASTRLTVYSGDYDALGQLTQPMPGMPGYALVERPLRYTLAAGSNAVTATNVSPAMDVEAALLQPRSPGVGVVAQRYIGALSGTQDVLARAIGMKIAVEHTSGGAKQTDSGTLLAANDGLSLALNDGRIKVIHDYDNFSIIDAGDALPREAALQWTVEAEKAGDAAFVLGYPMGGMAWRAEYLARITPGKGCQLALDGAAQVSNRSGVTFSNARLTLVAGEPRRSVTGGGARYREMAYADDYAAAAPAAAPPPPVERQSGEYHAYELPGTSRVSNGATERLPLFAARDSVACERVYLLDGGEPGWIPDRPQLAPRASGATGKRPVVASVVIQNTEDAGLGRALPAGRVRVFDGDDFLGESPLGHTANGEEIRLQVGTAFDLSAEREATAFSVDRSGRTITESFAIELRNAKQEAATVRVIEPLPRWRDWELVDSSVAADAKGAQKVEFLVPVPAEGTTTLTYTVRYRWPRELNP
ncbi:DUF4139 domain-containing protein [Marilutibacter spongiae]|uniref:DUF4139 domain-containing protein n=1 Tax=Marilutibacter spongiae TaxID=2025720 RepID=A0A7W3Y749_9GAMM|nr:DUF4139 domain-containing protein [Lysobacter spongiae]MBB1061937.1 DUF4139 domain-containing protein [Lysobacter spongiae]